MDDKDGYGFAEIELFKKLNVSVVKIAAAGIESWYLDDTVVVLASCCNGNVTSVTRVLFIFSVSQLYKSIVLS